MRRRLTKFVLFLLLGAVVNVAVAWGCAYWIEYDWRLTGTKGQFDHFTNWGLDSLIDNDDAKGFMGYTANRYQLFGSQRVSVLRSTSFSGAPGRTTIGFEDIIPRWARNFLDIPELNKNELEPDFDDALLDWRPYTHWSILDSRGWPSLSLWGGIKVPVAGLTIYDSDGKPIPLVEKRYWIFTLDTSSPPVAYTDYRWLPLHPIWPGFAINTIFYATILWLLTLGPFTARRFIRRKRGHCIKCGYDLRGAEHEVCPECGATP